MRTTLRTILLFSVAPLLLKGLIDSDATAEIIAKLVYIRTYVHMYKIPTKGTKRRHDFVFIKPIQKATTIQNVLISREEK